MKRADYTIAEPIAEIMGVLDRLEIELETVADENTADDIAQIARVISNMLARVERNADIIEQEATYKAEDLAEW